ncbi:MAG: ATP-binding protein [bacterium]
MVSTFAIVNVFLQVFTAGVALAGIYSFSVRYFEKKKREDYYLTLIFLALFVFTALTVISQMAYTLGQSLNVRFILYRIIAVDMVAGALFLAYFIKEKFNYRGTFIFQALLLGCIVEAVLIVRSPLNFVENIKGIAIDPGVHFLSALPPELFWITLWLILGIKYLLSARVSKESGEKNIYNLSGVSSVLVVMTFLLSFYYAKTGEPYYLAGSWAMYLCASVGFFLGNVILPKDEVAKFPLSYPRTKILYKLGLIFIFLIIIILEATTVATVNLNQISLQKAIKSNYQNLARSIADKIEYVSLSRGGVDKNFVQSLVYQETKGKRYVYVVSKYGQLFTGPDPKEAGRDLSALRVVKRVISGESGSDEYLSEFFEKVEDKAVIGAYAPIKEYNMGVIVEEPEWAAYSEVRMVSTNTLIFVIVGIILTVSAGIFFARSIEIPIKELIMGTQAVRKGDLSYKIRIDSIDEIGQLADAFNQMTKDLKQSQENLVNSEKLASLGTMAAGMAHEIKNPLVSLRTFTQLLPQRFEDEEFRKKFSTVVPQEIDKINKIAESLLRFGRPHKPELTQVNINEILEEILALFDNEARKSNVRVTTKLAELPKITADAGQLSQAIVNVILNAIQSMASGGELTVKTDVGEVIKLGPSGAETEEEEAKSVPVIFVEVSDTGIGIQEDNLKKIFDPFFTTKEVSGTGMGLPITLRIIEDHHGSIRVKSQIGKGTTFLVTLPQTQEEKT